MKARNCLALFASTAIACGTGVVGPPPDTTAPAVSITSPASETAVSATITISANATDDVGVAGVQLQLDGANLGAEDTTEPWSISWNTSGSTSGVHRLTAVARDAEGN